MIAPSGSGPRSAQSLAQIVPRRGTQFAQGEPPIESAVPLHCSAGRENRFRMVESPSEKMTFDPTALPHRAVGPLALPNVGPVCSTLTTDRKIMRVIIYSSVRM